MILVKSGQYVITFFFFQAEDGIRDYKVTGVQTCALPISQLAERQRRCNAAKGACRTDQSAQIREKLPPSARPRGPRPPRISVTPAAQRRGQVIAADAVRSHHCPYPTLRRYNDRAARVVKLVDTVDLKSTDAETRRAGSSPALGTQRSFSIAHCLPPKV